MHKTIRQMILGLGTFGTGTALLYLEVNPYLLILTDTVVGIGMLFAAGSLTMHDLHLRREGVPRTGPAIGVGTVPPDGMEGAAGLRASLGKLGGSLKPSVGRLSMGKEEKEAHTKEIDRILDTALVGQSKRLISIAEGQETALGAAATAAGIPQQVEDSLQELSAGGIGTPFPDDEDAGEEGTTLDESTLGPKTSAMGEISPASLLEPEEGKEEAQVDVLSLAGGGLGADDLLSALRLEAMKEKKKDDTSLLRDLKGVKVTGKQLLDELDSLVKDMRGR
jgi:hypothetical protein